MARETRTHNPQHRYDCGRCKYSWCCGLLCACSLRSLGPPPPSLGFLVDRLQGVRTRETRTQARVRRRIRSKYRRIRVPESMTLRVLVGVAHYLGYSIRVRLHPAQDPD